MTKALVLLSLEIGVVLLIRSVAWRRLVALVSEGRVLTRSGRGVAASLIRTSGHLWLLLGFVPTAVLVMTFIGADEIDESIGKLLAVSALGLIVWCAWNAVQRYRWAWRVSQMPVGADDTSSKDG